jgi:hypothetical protein
MLDTHSPIQIIVITRVKRGQSSARETLRPENPSARSRPGVPNVAQAAGLLKAGLWLHSCRCPKMPNKRIFPRARVRRSFLLGYEPHEYLESADFWRRCVHMFVSTSYS